MLGGACNSAEHRAGPGVPFGSLCCGLEPAVVIVSEEKGKDVGRV